MNATFWNQRAYNLTLCCRGSEVSKQFLRRGGNVRAERILSGKWIDFGTRTKAQRPQQTREPRRMGPPRHQTPRKPRPQSSFNSSLRLPRQELRRSNGQPPLPGEGQVLHGIIGGRPPRSKPSGVGGVGSGVGVGDTAGADGRSELKRTAESALVASMGGDGRRACMVFPPRRCLFRRRLWSAAPSLRQQRRRCWHRGRTVPPAEATVQSPTGGHRAAEAPSHTRWRRRRRRASPARPAAALRGRASQAPGRIPLRRVGGRACNAASAQATLWSLAIRRSWRQGEAGHFSVAEFSFCEPRCFCSWPGKEKACISWRVVALRLLPGSGLLIIAPERMRAPEGH